MATRWIVRTTPRPHAELRLFCFSYAGGAAAAFRSWSNHLPASIDVCPIELPGRGARWGEAAYTRLPALVQAVAEAIRPELDCPFALFGHSMGALVSFELARQLRRTHRLGPVHLLVSAHRAPQLPDPDPYTHTLSDDALVDKLRSLEGTPQEILDQPELMQLLLPRLRADFEVCDTYVYRPDAPLDCPITVFGGSEDRIVSPADLEPWKAQTRVESQLHLLPGSHFYLHTAQLLLLHLIAGELRHSLERHTVRARVA